MRNKNEVVLFLASRLEHGFAQFRQRHDVSVMPELRGLVPACFCDPSHFQFVTDRDWRPEIERELEAMDVFAGLLTTNFVASNFIQRVEFKRAIERRKDKTARMWLVLVDDRRIEGTKFEGIQVLKPDGKAVSRHKNLRAGFDAVEKELHQLVIELWKSQPQSDE